MRSLNRFEKELLLGGNCYSFAHLVLELYANICEDASFDFSDAVNRYKACTDFNDGVYTLRGKNGVKYFFDCDMQFRGTKS